MEVRATTSMLTRPDERRFPLRHHLLPSSAVLVVVGGLVLDRVTLRAPPLVRVPAPVIVPLVGAALVAAGIDLGFLVIELSVPLAGYWALFLAHAAVFRLLRLLRAGLGRSPGR